jgi:hypothetical protein
MPFLIFLWAFLRFYFFFLVGIFLIIPTNLVILVRNLFPGHHWKYRPFFLSHLYYVWLWLWRGEAPTAALVFVRPLLVVLTKMQFTTRLKRLRMEISLRDELSDTARSTLQGRIDAALELWKTPRFASIFSTVLVPAIISFPAWWKQTTEFVSGLGIRLPTDTVVSFISQNTSAYGRYALGSFAIGYLLAIPVTACLAKRGLFLGMDPKRICFPGEEAGSGVYPREREILGSVGIHEREAPVDLWALAVTWILGVIWQLSTWNTMMEYVRSQGSSDSFFLMSLIGIGSITVAAFVLAALRRRISGRA